MTRMYHYFLSVRVWQWTVLSIVFFALSLFLLRQNSLGVIERQEAVIAADQKGEGVQEALSELAEYVFNHMNTTVDSIQLVTTYEQDRLAAVEAAQDNVDSQIIIRAQAACDRGDTNLQRRAACVADYLLANGSGGNSVQAKLPLVSDYTFSFVSPIWSTDIAGFALLAATSLAVLALIRYFIKEERFLTKKSDT